MRLVTLLLAAVSLFAADSKFTGKWEGNSSSGEMVISTAGSAISDVYFTYEGSKVPCKILDSKLEAGKILLQYQFDLGGFKLVSTLTGNAKENSVEGTYKTTSPDGAQIDSGTFKASSTK